MAGTHRERIALLESRFDVLETSMANIEKMMEKVLKKRPKKEDSSFLQGRIQNLKVVLRIFTMRDIRTTMNVHREMSTIKKVDPSSIVPFSMGLTPLHG